MPSPMSSSARRRWAWRAWSSTPGRTPARGSSAASGALDEVTRRTEGYRVRVALENTAGAGHTVGRTFEELATLIDRAARPERIGVCIDTCHLFAAGYDIRHDEGWDAAAAECTER